MPATGAGPVTGAGVVGAGAVGEAEPGVAGAVSGTVPLIANFARFPIVCRACLVALRFSTALALTAASGVLFLFLRRWPANGRRRPRREWLRPDRESPWPSTRRGPACEAIAMLRAAMPVNDGAHKGAMGLTYVMSKCNRLPARDESWRESFLVDTGAVDCLVAAGKRVGSRLHEAHLFGSMDPLARCRRYAPMIAATKEPTAAAAPAPSAPAPSSHPQPELAAAAPSPASAAALPRGRTQRL